jgi:hypothetical protein
MILSDYLLVTKVAWIMNHHFDGIYWEEYINPVKSFSSRAHIGICQNAPRPLNRMFKIDQSEISKKQSIKCF